MVDIICVYDISATAKCKVYSLKENKALLSFNLPVALVKRPSNENEWQHPNFKHALFNPTSPDFSLFLSYNASTSRFAYRNDLLVTLPEILFSFCNDKESDKPYVDAEAYFESLKKYVNGVLKRADISADKNILLVPDSLPIESQEKLLSYFGKYDTQLQWRSVAIFLGAENLIKGISQISSVAVLDRFSIDMLYSKIGIKVEHNRIIPCHKLYKKANGAINRDWYTSNFLSNKPELINNTKNNRLEACYRTQGYSTFPDVTKNTVPSLVDVSALSCSANLRLIPFDASAVFVPSTTKANRDNFIHEDLNDLAFKGAKRCMEYINAGETPYYDECESFSVVFQTAKEEVEYLELIAANEFLPAGKISEGNKVRELGIGKGNTKLDIYLHLGDKSKTNVQLKKHTQQFPLEEPLDADRPLILSPSIMPGQGYAYVTVEDGFSEKLFAPIELNFKNMSLAFDGKIPITKDYIEKQMKRSFPPDVPPVRCRYRNADIPQEMINKLDRFTCRGHIGFPNSFYNSSVWPNILDPDKGLERFVRENVFGAYTKDCSLEDRFPSIKNIKPEYYLNQFEDISREYVISCAQGDPQKELIPWMAWSYQRYNLTGKLLPYAKQATDCLLTNIRSKRIFTLTASEASYIANMIVTKREFEIVIELFKQRLKQSSVRLSNWCRAIYQLLMYTDFIYKDSDLKDEDIRFCMLHLAEYLADEYENYSSEQITDLFLRAILYMLRYRVRQKSFCQKDSDPVLYTKSGLETV